MRPTWYTHPASLALLASLALSCNSEELVLPPTGSLDVTITADGADPAADYTITLDSGNPPETHAVGPAGTFRFPDLPGGDHVVLLGALAANCSVAGENPRTVSVTVGETASVSFEVSCTIGATRWISIPLPPGVTAEIGWGTSRSLWGTSPTDLFVVGSTTEARPRSGVWHYDGQGWAQQVSRVDTTLIGIWGNSATDVFAIGRPTALNREPAAILHYDGSRWSDMAGPVYNPAVAYFSYYGIWGAGPRDVFLAGGVYRSTPATQLLGHYDGVRWSEMPTPAFGVDPGFTDLAGTSGTDVWAIGSRELCDDCNYSIAIAAHYDGQEWREALAETADFFHGVWATAANDVWVVGENDEYAAKILHFDGAGWTGWTSGEPFTTTEGGLKDVWASSASDVYAVGPSTLLHYDGTGWSKISDVVGDRVWGTSSRDVFVLRAHEILHGAP